jgi:hypothetical protein
MLSRMPAMKVHAMRYRLSKHQLDGKAIAGVWTTISITHNNRYSLYRIFYQNRHFKEIFYKIEGTDFIYPYIFLKSFFSSPVCFREVRFRLRRDVGLTTN